MTGGDITEARADRDQQIGLFDQSGESGIHAQPGVTGIVGVRVIETILAPKGRGYRQPLGLGECLQSRPAFGGPARATEDRQWPSGIGEQRSQAGHRLGGRIALAVRRGSDIDWLDTRVQEVFRQTEYHRALPAGTRRREGPAEVFGQPRGVLDVGRPLGHRTEQRTDVHLLPGFALAEATGYLADEYQQGRGILCRHVQPGQRIGAARSARDEAYPGSPGGLGIGFGHHRGTAFLAADHQGDVRRVMQCIEHRQEALARNRENAVHAVAPEQLDDGLAGVGSVVFCHRVLSGSPG